MRPSSEPSPALVRPGPASPSLHCPIDSALHAEEVAELEWHEHLWFVEALVDSLRDGVVTAPDIVIYVKHTPRPSELSLDT